MEIVHKALVILHPHHIEVFNRKEEQFVMSFDELLSIQTKVGKSITNLYAVLILNCVGNFSELFCDWNFTSKAETIKLSL